MSHKVKILLNREEIDGRLAIFTRFGTEPKYRAGDALEEVASFTTDRGEGVLDLAFEMFNRGAPKFVGDYIYPHRSLSVGDVIQIGGCRWSVETVGFMPIIEPETDEEGIARSHAAEMLEADERWHPENAERRMVEDEIDNDPDLTREAFEEMMAEGEVISAEESWAGGFSQFIDGQGNGSGRY